MHNPLTLLTLLENNISQFDFFQALRLIENAYPEQPRIGQALHPRDEAVRFGQDPELRFQAAAISGFEPASDNKRARLAVSFFGLTGPNGALPIHLTEYARDRLRNAGDPTFARFLDIFHHRMLALFYRARAVSEPVIQLDRDDDDRFSAYIGSFFGMGTPALRQRDTVPDFAKLHFAGLMSNRTKHASGLAAILCEFFQLPVAIEQFVGHWMLLPLQIRSRLGTNDGNSHLGLSTILGAKVWDCQSKFRIVIGPLDHATYCRMLPGGDSLLRLVDWVRNYVGDALEWDVQLLLKKEQVPPLLLGETRLGWTSWVHSQPATNTAKLLFHPATHGPHLSL